MKFSSLFWPRVLVTADHAKLVFGQSNYATLDSYELEDFSTFLSGIFCASWQRNSTYLILDNETLCVRHRQKDRRRSALNACSL